jgi:hypothetical protein
LPSCRPDTTAPGHDPAATVGTPLATFRQAAAAAQETSMKLSLIAMAVAGALSAGAAWAGPPPVGPGAVPGKEFSTTPDMTVPGFSSPGQTTLWNPGPTVADGYNYNMPRSEVDAMAASQDFLFTEVVNNQATLLFNVDNETAIYWEAPNGDFGFWAPPPNISGSSNERLDALEVWGGDGQPDATHFSLLADGLYGTSVWEYDPGSNTSSGVYSVADIANAIGLDDRYWRNLDVDALMMNGDSILFSIAPIAGLYDGGEIWVWNGDRTAAATFLKHGGHTWDTAFDIRGTYGLSNENVTVLEAIYAPIPEPSTWALTGLGLLGLLSSVASAKRRR